MEGAKSPSPLRDFIIPHSERNMNKKSINFLLSALVVLNILDGDLSRPSILDIVKFALLILCFYLNNRKER